ncbi:MAG TPA: hypothetical protein DCM87_20210 [Planctomycetes bacterium]|nr:hypothetical protein [Planctomycetota bacterium]
MTALLGLLSLPFTAADLVKIDCSRAAAYATHTTDADEYHVRHIIDGDLANHWVGEGHPLTWQPTNVIIVFPEPVAIAGVAITSETLRDVLALRDFEIYAWAGDAWAGATPLAAVKDNRDLRVTAAWPPVRTSRLRIRITDTWRADHAFPRLREVEVYGPARADAAAAPRAAPLPGEKESERLTIRRAMGEKIVYPGEPYDPAKGYLHYARACLDTLIAEGTDRYGPVPSPMFASLLDMETHAIPDDAPPNVPGQRSGDRTLRGGNLFHDVMLLGACDAVTALTGDPKYRRAATAYLEFFAAHCPQRTGLFPWGEHAHWDFFAEKPGHATHEFLGGVPASFWERLWTIDARAVAGEGEGLLNHVVDLGTFAYDRHADIGAPLPSPRPAGLGFMDFPRHGGFYIHLWSFLAARTGDAKYRDWSDRALDHIMRARDPVSGLPPACSGRDGTVSLETLLSLAVSLGESARLLGEQERFERTARDFLDAILSARHDPAAGRFMTSVPRGGRVATAGGDWSDPYRCVYGGGFTADNAVLLLAAHRMTGDARALALAEGFASFYAAHEPPPPHEIVRAHVYASILGLFVDLYDLTRKPAHLEQAERHARLAIGRLYHRGLFRGATSVNCYEGDLMPGSLVYNLVRLHAVTAAPDVVVEPNYFNR